jgi:parvulin-like peptidyl-prolyl isomerase
MYMRYRVTFLAILLLGAVVSLGLLMSCGGKSDRAVARVGDQVITVQDYNDQYLAMSLPVRPKQMHTMDGKRRFLEDVINKEIMAGEARRLGFEDDPTLSQTVKMMTDQEILRLLREENVENRVSLEPGEARSYYDQMGEESRVELLIYGKRAEAEAALERAAKGTPFSTLVKESMIAQAYPDADLGWRTWGDLDEPLNTEVFALEPGQMSDVIEMVGGVFAVARVMDTRPNEDLGTFQEARPLIVEKIKTSKTRARYAEWIRESISGQQVEVDDEVLANAIDRLEWGFDDSGVEKRPEFSAEEEAQILGAHRGGEMTLGAFVDQLMAIPISSRPDKKLGEAEFRRLTQMFLVNEALLAEGYGRGMHESPALEQKIRRSKEERTVTMLYNSIIRDVVVTEEDIRSYYDDYKDSLREAAKYHLSRIVTDTKADGEAALREVRSGRGFADVVEKWSTDSHSAKMGGKLSPTTADILPPEVRELVVTLGKGDSGGPVETEDGWMVIRLDDYTPERELTFEETRDNIGMQLRQTRQNDAFESWLAQKREELGVEIYEDVLESITLVADKPAPPEGAAPGGQDDSGA